MMNEGDPSNPEKDEPGPAAEEEEKEKEGEGSQVEEERLKVREETPASKPWAGPPQQEEEESAEEERVDPPSLEQIAAAACQTARTILSFFPKVKKPIVRWRLEERSIWVEIEGDPSGRLIGRKGQTIEAFQHVLSKIISHRFRKKITINVDAEGYKRRHREKLEKLARLTADYVAKSGEARALEPMSATDRRVIHLALRHRTDVITASEGEEPERFIVIWPKRKEE